MTLSERIGAVLRALEFTPQTVMKELGVGNMKAKSILAGKAKIQVEEYNRFCEITGINAKLLIRDLKMNLNN